MPPVGTAPYGTLRGKKRSRRLPRFGIGLVLGLGPLLAVLGLIAMTFLLVVIMVFGKHQTPSTVPGSTRGTLSVTTPPPPTTPCFPFQTGCGS